MISTRYAPAIGVVLALALVPTIIHSYVGSVQADGRRTNAISTSLAGFSSTPSTRDSAWGQRRFESFDWVERTYSSSSGDVRLTVIRSYDAKRLYHHPELDVAYGAGYLKHEVVYPKAEPTLPMHVLSTDVDRLSTAVYALHYGEGFVDDPLLFQVRTAGQLLFSARRPMTLIFARDLAAPPSAEPESFPSTRVLLAAIHDFLSGSAPAQ